MRFMAIVLSVCLLMQAPIIALADAQKAVPLHTGETAPFDGILVPPDRIQEFLGAEIERDELKVKFKTQKRLHQIEMDEYERALNLKWYQEPRFNQAVGFVLGIVVFGGAVWGAGQIND